jgi:hypothetical protein
MPGLTCSPSPSRTFSVTICFERGAMCCIYCLEQPPTSRQPASPLNPTFSTRGVSDPGSRSRWTSWLKGLHYKSYARVFSSNLPADLVCMALRMEGAVTTNDCNHKSRAGK